MKQLNKKERRRQNIINEHWLGYHGDPSRPRRFAYDARRALKIQ